MPRIVAGAAGGRRLAVPSGRATRPTSDRAREALYSTLAGLVELSGAAVLDLYAGSGAVGLEALSRGASRAVLVESDATAVQAIRDNVSTLGLAGAEVVAGRVEHYCQRSTPGEFDVVFADPPYALADPVVGSGLVRTGGIIVVERASRNPAWQWPQGIAPIKEKRYGDSTLWYGRRS